MPSTTTASAGSITGGFVYRGYSLGAAYRGRYFYGDFVTARIWSIGLIPAGGGEVTVSAPIEHTAELGGSGAIGNISAFGIDAVGELYIVSYSSGQILKVVTATVYRPLDPSDIDGDQQSGSGSVATIHRRVDRQQKFRWRQLQSLLGRR